MKTLVKGNHRVKHKFTWESEGEPHVKETKAEKVLGAFPFT